MLFVGTSIFLAVMLVATGTAHLRRASDQASYLQAAYPVLGRRSAEAAAWSLGATELAVAAILVSGVVQDAQTGLHVFGAGAGLLLSVTFVVHTAVAYRSPKTSRCGCGIAEHNVTELTIVRALLMCLGFIAVLALESPSLPLAELVLSVMIGSSYALMMLWLPWVLSPIQRPVLGGITR